MIFVNLVFTNMQLSSEPQSSEEGLIKRPPMFEYINWLDVIRRAVGELLEFKEVAKRLERESPNNKEVFRGFERDFFELMSALASDNLGRTITHNEDLPEVDSQKDKIIYICNHPTLTTIWVWSCFMSQNFAYNTFAIGKDDIIKNPIIRYFLGDLMQRTGKGVFIPRGKGDREASSQIIRTLAKEALTEGSSGIIFPDAHRPYPSRIKKAQEKWSVRKPDLNIPEWLTETCFPHSGGLWDFGQAAETDVRFFDCTIVEPTVTHAFGGNLHFDVQEISREDLFGETPDLEYFQEKLIELWMRKNQMIREKRTLLT
ncbi:MAG: 1-acyl-sn-glycerol-3-phosphate acyltransferase [Candidatus Peregrinibacteria bacterium]|nr:1-acyl-sn-glycerol-3-phosphate acyltransferase [Candidatus Peregrinibacteria bacterium]